MNWFSSGTPATSTPSESLHRELGTTLDEAKTADPDMEAHNINDR